MENLKARVGTAKTTRTHSEKILNDINTGKTHIYTIRPNSTYRSLLQSAKINNYVSQNENSNNQLTTYRSQSGYKDSINSVLQSTNRANPYQQNFRDSILKKNLIPVNALLKNMDQNDVSSSEFGNKNEAIEKSQYFKNSENFDKLNTVNSINTMSDYRINRPFTANVGSPISNTNRFKKSACNHIKSCKYLNPNGMPIAFTGNDLSSIKTTRPSSNYPTTEMSQTNFFTASDANSSKVTFKFSSNGAKASKSKEKNRDYYLKMQEDGTLQKVTENVNKYYPGQSFKNFEDLQSSFEYIDILNTTIQNVEEGEYLTNPDEVYEIGQNKAYNLKIEPKVYFHFKIKVKNEFSPIKIKLKKICNYNSNYELFYSFQNEKVTYQTQYLKKYVNPDHVEIKCRFKGEKFKDNYLFISYFSDTTMTIKTAAQFSKKQKLVFKKSQLKSDNLNGKLGIEANNA